MVQKPKSKLIISHGNVCELLGHCLDYSKNILMFIFERDSMSWGGAEREGDTESEVGFRL